MKVFIELSGDLPEPIIGSRCVEVEALLEIFPGKLLKCTRRYAIADVEDPQALASRLSMAHTVARYLGKAEEPEEFVDDEFLVVRSRIGGKNITVKEALEIARSFGATPDLNAERKMVLFLAEDGIHVAVDPIDTIRRKLFARRPAARPIHEPPTLDPYTSLFLVNLARARSAERILDPFCGFGSILMEAYYVGSKPIGIDLRERALRGTIRNFEHFFSERPELILGDSTLGIVEGIKHVATDPPRGRMLKKGLEARYKFLDRTDAHRVSAVLGRLHDPFYFEPIYYGVRFRGKKKELKFVVYELNKSVRCGRFLSPLPEVCLGRPGTR